MNTSDLFAKVERVKVMAIALLAGALLISGCGDSPENLQRKEAEHLRLAEFYLEQGSIRASVIEIRNALQVNPMSGRAHYVMGTAALLASDSSAALKEFELAEELGFTAPDISLQKIRAMMRLGRKEDVRAEIERLASQFGNSAEFWVLKGDSELSWGNIEAAEAAYTQSKELTDANAEALLGLAKVALATGDSFSVETYLDQALETDPELAEAWIWKARLALLSGKARDAEEAFFRAREAEGTDILTAIKMIAVQGIVSAKVSQGKYAEADAYYRDFLERYPQSSAASVDRALSMLRGGDLTGAERLLKDVLVNAPGNTSGALLLGYINYSQGDWAEAERALEGLLKDNELSPQVVRLFAMTQLKQNRPANAVEVLRTVIESGSDDAQMYALFGLASYLTGDKAGGQAALERAVEMEPENSEIRQNLARVYFSEGNRRKAIDELKKAISLDSETGDAWARLLAIYLSGDQLDEAAALFAQQLETVSRDSDGQREVMRRFLKIAVSADKADWAEERLRQEARDPDVLVQSRLVLSDYYLSVGRSEESVLLANKVLEADSTNTRALAISGTADVIAKRYDEATRKFVTITEVDPGSPDGYYFLGRLELARRNPDSAIDWAKRAINAKADFVPGFTTLVIALQEVGRLDEALTYVSKIRQIDPASAQGAELEGDVRIKREELSQASEAYRAAFQRQPKSRVVVKLFGALKADGKPREAVEALRAWVDENPGDIAAEMRLATEYLASGEVVPAIKHFESLQKSTPDTPLVLNNLAWLYGETGDTRAIAIAERALELAPENPAILDTLGWLYFKDGELGKAIPLLQKAARDAPDDQDIKDHLAQALEKSGGGQ